MDKVQTLGGPKDACLVSKFNKIELFLLERLSKNTEGRILTLLQGQQEEQDDYYYAYNKSLNFD